MAKALEGVKVLDFTQYLSGPHCTSVLCELGAEIIKVERAGSGDPERKAAPMTPKGESYQFIAYNRGKKSVTLNIKNRKGLEIARKLVSKCDILVENFAPGVMERFGLGYEEASKINPGIIYASISGFGQTGPRRDQVAFDVIGQAMGGLMSVTGYEEGGPLKVGVSLADYMGGYNAAIAILAALHYKTVTGEGQHIDISMQDGIWAMVFPDRADYFETLIPPKRIGNRLSSSSPFGSYKAKDGHVVICTITDEQWQNVLKAMGREDLSDDERFATRVLRTKNMADVESVLYEWLKDKTVEEAIAALEKFKVPCSPVPTFEQVANDPQILHREMIIEVEQPLSGKVKVGGSPYKMSKTPGNRKLRIPLLGQHNEEIYGGLLGIDKNEIERLKAEGVI
ncbi:MAG TPA: CoA transferase [Bacillota bacterium]|jgi:CoA:oxalate CoA-transferase|nr:CoA transferase [Bacillota bacterium]HOJ84686.1 CoA transferase [Bacillota bacterium]HOL15620.1 CoA transferase [Bacillota bacterium]HPZ11474.1 CoA transferase [Bacillota bacterium]HQE10713.1 CoA transferase [Bacillota bacterium]